MTHILTIKKPIDLPRILIANGKKYKLVEIEENKCNVSKDHLENKKIMKERMCKLQIMEQIKGKVVYFSRKEPESTIQVEFKLKRGSTLDILLKKHEEDEFIVFRILEL